MREVIEISLTGLYHLIVGNRVHVFERLCDAEAAQTRLGLA